MQDCMLMLCDNLNAQYVESIGEISGASMSLNEFDADASPGITSPPASSSVISNQNVGFYFTPTEKIRVTHLGFCATEEVDPGILRIWRDFGGNILASTSAGGTLIGGYKYVQIPTIILQPGVTYIATIERDGSGVYYTSS